MAQITLGYGDFSGYQLSELPDHLLGELAQRFPLRAAHYDASDGEVLLIAVAVHEETARRGAGGQPTKHTPTAGDFAVQIVKCGFRTLSKTHHPDQQGDNAAQRRLIEARDRLIQLCDNVRGDPPPDGITIQEPPPRQTSRTQSPFPHGISDDDVPF